MLLLRRRPFIIRPVVAATAARTAMASSIASSWRQPAQPQRKHSSSSSSNNNDNGVQKQKEQKQKIVVITGTTGVGKTRLSVDIARRFNGEVVNSDAMQMYRHLDIATAKVTEEEKCGVKHHLMSFLDPTDQYSVSAYQKAAHKVIADIAARGKLPVVVGGTMFYVEAVLWNSLFDQDAETSQAAAAEGRGDSASAKRKASEMMHEDSNGSSSSSSSNSSSKSKPNPSSQVDNGNDNSAVTALSASNDRLLPESLTAEQKQQLWEELQAVDPVSANRIHPNNARRVYRSLEVFKTTGRPHSAIIEEHRQQKDSQELRYDAHVVWLHCAPDILDERLDARVEGMREQGLIAEVRRLWESTVKQAAAVAAPGPAEGSCENSEASLAGENEQADAAAEQDLAMDAMMQRGVLKSIGFKEFCDYFSLLDRAEGQDSSPGQVSAESTSATSSAKADAASVLEECIVKLKQSTRRYARKQVRWIRNRVVARGVRVHRYETDDVDAWSTTVEQPALASVAAWLDGGDAMSVEGAQAAPRPEEAAADGVAGNSRGAAVVVVDEGVAAEKSFWKSRDLGAWKRHHCAICNRTLDGQHEWESHLRSRRHKKQKAFVSKPLHPKDRRRRQVATTGAPVTAASVAAAAAAPTGAGGGQTMGLVPSATTSGVLTPNGED